MKMEHEEEQIRTQQLPLSFLENSNLDTDAKFVYLRSQLEKFYKENLGSRYVVVLEKSHQWNKQVHNHLHLLLNEIVMTKDFDEQQRVLSKVNDWYIGLMNVPKRPEFLHTKSNILSVNLPEVVVRNVKKTKKVKKFYMPKSPKPNTREDILDYANQQYYRMLQDEKLGLNTAGSRKNMKKPLNRIITASDLSIQPEIQADLRSFSKKPSKTPDHLLETIEETSKSPLQMDFRPISHKSRVIVGGKMKKQFLLQNVAKRKEVVEIHNIKSRLAQRKLPVSINCLENALLLNDMNFLDNITPQDLPRGGELLFRSPLPSLKPSSLSPKRPRFQS